MQSLRLYSVLTIGIAHATIGQDATIGIAYVTIGQNATKIAYFTLVAPSVELTPSKWRRR